MIPERITLVAADGLFRAVFHGLAKEAFPSASIKVNEKAIPVLIALRLEPTELVIVDTQTEDLDGLDCVREVLSQKLAERLIIVSRRRDERSLTVLSEVRGQVWLDGSSLDFTEISRAFRASSCGNHYVSTSLKNALGQQRSTALHHLLSPIEQLAFSVLGEGLDDQEAAECLGSRAGTVRAHRERIMRKLQLHHRAQLATLAHARGYIRSVNGDLLHPGFAADLERIQAYGREAWRAGVAGDHAPFRENASLRRRPAVAPKADLLAAE